MTELHDSDNLRSSRKSQHYLSTARDIVINVHGTPETHKYFGKLVGRVADYLAYLDTLPKCTRRILGQMLYDPRSIGRFIALLNGKKLEDRAKYPSPEDTARCLDG